MRLSKLDPEKAHNVGGIGILNRGNKMPAKPIAKDLVLRSIIDKGRIGHYGMTIGNGTFLRFYVIYG